MSEELIGGSIITEGLLPCPFCDSQAQMELQGNDYTKSRAIVTRCPECRIQVTNKTLRHGFEWLLDISIKAWNKRA